MQTINTLVILKTQFSNIFEGAKLAQLTYEAEYNGDDKRFLETYEENLFEEICMQCDFWECVTNYKERFSVKVRVLGNPEGKEDLENKLTKLVTDSIVERVGRSPESSFEDDMTEEDKARARQAKFFRF